MPSLSSNTALATFVVRLKLPDGATEQISGCDSNDLERAVRAASAVSRWVHGGVLYSGAFSGRALRDVFDLRRSLRRRNIDRFAVQIECVAIMVAADRSVHEDVIWPPSAEQLEDGDYTDTVLEMPHARVSYTLDVNDPRR